MSISVILYESNATKKQPHSKNIPYSPISWQCVIMKENVKMASSSSIDVHEYHYFGVT